MAGRPRKQLGGFTSSGGMGSGEWYHGPTLRAAGINLSGVANMGGTATQSRVTRRRTAKGGLRNVAAQQTAATTTQTPRRGRKPKNPTQA